MDNDPTLHMEALRQHILHVLQVRRDAQWACGVADATLGFTMDILVHIGVSMGQTPDEFEAIVSGILGASRKLALEMFKQKLKEEADDA